MSNLFGHSRARVSKAKPKIQISRGQSKIYFDFAEREYLRRSQRYEKIVWLCRIIITRSLKSLKTLRSFGSLRTFFGEMNGRPRNLKGSTASSSIPPFFSHNHCILTNYDYICTRTELMARCPAIIRTYRWCTYPPSEFSGGGFLLPKHQTTNIWLIGQNST